MELPDQPDSLEIKLEKDTDDCGPHVDIQTIDGRKSLLTNGMINICNGTEKPNWVAVRPSVIYGPNDVLGSQAEIKIEKDIDGYGSNVCIQTTADNENLETYQPMNICNDDTKLNCVVGQASMFHEPPAKCQNSFHTKGKTQNTKGKCFHCDICNKSFSNIYVIKRHMLFHLEKSHSCATCSRSYTLPADLKKHQRIHTGEKPYKCDICEKRFRFSSNLSSHVRLHNGVKPHVCDKCSKCFTARSSLKYHVQHVHGGEQSVKLHKYGICERRHLKTSSFTVYKKIHSGDKPYECGTCCSSFTCLSYLKKHLRMHKAYSCVKCKKSFTYAGMQYHTLHVHKETKTETESPKVKQCNQTVASKIKTKGMLRRSKQYPMEQNSSLNYDITKMSSESSEQVNVSKKQHVSAPRVILIPHSIRYKSSLGSDKSNRFSCLICIKAFGKLRYLRRHMLYHTKEGHSCDTCGRSLRSTTDLRNHKRIHTGEKPYKCDLCGKCFTLPGTLLSHKRRHTGERSHKCKFCGKSFFESNDLKRHCLIHTNTKPLGLICETCGKSFTHRISLRYHIEYVHNAKQRVKQHQCDLCSKNFSQSRSLLVHMRFHSGNRPHKCKYWGKSFFRSNDLDRHYLTHMDIKQLDNTAVSMEQNLARNHEIAEKRFESIKKADEAKKQTVSESRAPDPKIKRRTSSEETKNEAKDPAVKPCDQSVGNEIKFKGLILRSKEFDSASISNEQSLTLQNNIAGTSKKSTDQADEANHSNTPCLLESIKWSKDLSSGANYATKFCNLDLRRRIAQSARNKRNNTV